jgi:tetratricopeptide (TPR) repeat protein
LNGHFVFDDSSLPFATIVRDQPLRSWLASVRPALMFSYWVNFQLAGGNPFSYHLTNVLIHWIDSVLAMGILYRLFSMAEWPQRRAVIAAVAGAALFAIHPLQTESVSYVAGRSESLAATFLLLAYLLYLRRRSESISWLETGAVLLLFGLGFAAKENAVAFAGILVLTDLFWPKPFSTAGIRRNWRLYAIMAPAAVVATVFVFRMLAHAPSAGFSMGTKWYEYAFTEARAIFTYIRLAVFPVGQALDQDYATSHTIFEHGALFYILALTLLVAAAIWRRRQYPLFCFGLLMFLIWLAPTSSVVPLEDALVERRMYLPMLGLILMAGEMLSRMKLGRATALLSAGVLALIYGKLCYDRNQMWAQPDRLVELAAARAVHNPRPLLNLTEVLIRQNRCDLAPRYLERAEGILGSNYYVNAAWGRTLACLGRFDEAVARLQAAAREQPTSAVFEWMGLVYGQMGLLEKSREALEKSVEIDPKSVSAHGTLAFWYEKTRNFKEAEKEYRAALALDRYDAWAQVGLLRMRSRASQLQLSR